MANPNAQKGLVEKGTTEEYAQRKGLPVTFKNKNGDLLEGILVNWNNDDALVVVGRDGDKLITKVIPASDLYKLPENSRLQGAVEFARQHASELADTRSEISKMLQPVMESVTKPSTKVKKAA